MGESCCKDWEQKTLLRIPHFPSSPSKIWFQVLQKPISPVHFFFFFNLIENYSSFQAWKSSHVTYIFCRNIKLGRCSRKWYSGGDFQPPWAMCGDKLTQYRQRGWLETAVFFRVWTGSQKPWPSVPSPVASHSLTPLPAPRVGAILLGPPQACPETKGAGGQANEYWVVSAHCTSGLGLGAGYGQSYNWHTALC